MTLAHISDTHLGYFAYGKTSQGRLNQREVDVVETFRRCLDSIAERDPDLVLHSGDFFDRVRPSNYSLIAAYKLLCAFQARRNARPFVIIGGNHDTPQSADLTHILRLFDGIPGVFVETEAARILEFDQTAVLCLPNKCMRNKEHASWAPPRSKTPILVLHGLIRDVDPKIDRYDFEAEETRPSDWAYVAMGDYHVHQTYGANICYSGSTDFTSNNPWEESTRPKGWVHFDTESSLLEFVAVPTRPVFDLPVLDASGMTAQELADALLRNATWPGEELSIVRQVVINVHPATRRPYPMAEVRKIGERALHYKLDLRSPANMGTDPTERGEAATLESLWEQHVGLASVPPGIETREVTGKGLELLREVAEREIAPVEA